MCILVGFSFDTCVCQPDWPAHAFFLFQKTWKIYRRQCRNVCLSYSVSSRLSLANTRPSTRQISSEPLAPSSLRSKVSNHPHECVSAQRRTGEDIVYLIIKSPGCASRSVVEVYIILSIWPLNYPKRIFHCSSLQLP